VAMTQARKKEIVWWILIGILVLLGGGMAMSYSLHTKLETAFQEKQIEYAIEKGKTKTLTENVAELVKVMEQAQLREKTLKERLMASEEEKVRLQVKGGELATALQESQTAYATEQDRTKDLTQRVVELLKAMEQVQAQVMKTVERAQARVVALEQSQKAAEEEKSKVEARSRRIQQAHQVVRRALTAEEAKTKQLTQEVEKTSKAMKQAQDRVMSLEEKRKGEMMKRNGRINVEEAHKTWGKGFKQAIDRIFF